MEEMMALEEERVARMTAHPEGQEIEEKVTGGKTAEDESIVRRELNKADPSGRSSDDFRLPSSDFLSGSVQGVLGGEKESNTCLVTLGSFG
jgi:hypothetical protein